MALSHWAKLVKDCNLLGVWWKLHDLIRAVVWAQQPWASIVWEAIKIRSAKEWAASNYAGTQAWRKWATATIGDNGKALYQWIKRDEASQVITAPIVAGLPEVGHTGFLSVVSEWWAEWAKHDSGVDAHPTQDELRASTLKQWSVSEFRKLLRSCPKGKNVGVDQWSLLTWAQLPDAFLDRLLGILMAWEEVDYLPQSWASLVCLIGKPSGGHRPVALTAGPVRAWGRLRSPEMQSWAASVRGCCHVHSGPHACELMPYCHAIEVEAAFAQGREGAGIFMDLRRAFDQVSHMDVLCAVRKHHLPARLWSTACSLYGGCRHLVWQQQVSLGRRVRGSILPGCSLATGFMLALLLDLMREVAAACPRLLSSNLVDDIAITSVGLDAAVAHDLLAGADIALRRPQVLGLPLSEGKCVIVASRESIAQELLRHLGPHGFVARSQHRVLGLEAICTRRRRVVLQRARVKMASRRLSRVTKLRRASRRSLARAARASPGASLLFGSTQVGIAPGRLRAVRRRFARAMTKLPLRTATGLFTASSKPLAEADPGHLHHAA
eukprot:4644697-Amphidinium_carterae.1